MSGRYEVRLADEHRKKLAELAEEYHTNSADALRRAIDLAYEKAVRVRRLTAAEELGLMEVEEVPDIETLSRQLEEAHDPGLP